MQLDSIIMENFFSHEKSIIDFKNLSSISLLMGTIASNERESNGSGKTTILEAMRYAIYEKTRYTDSTNGTLDDMVRWNSTGKMKVVFQFIIAESLYRITRTRNLQTKKGTTKFEVQSNNKWIDKSGENKKSTNKEILKTIGIDYETFCQTVCFQPKDVDAFIDATESERKEIIKDIMQLKRFDSYKVAAKTSLKMNTDELKSIDKELAAIKVSVGDITSKEAELKKVEGRIKIYETEKTALDSQIEKLRKKQILFNDQVTQKSTLVNQIKDRSRSVVRLEEHNKQAESKKDEYDKAHKGRQAESKKLKAEYNKIKDLFSIEKKDIMKDGKAADKRLKTSEKELEKSSAEYHKLAGEVEGIEKNIKSTQGSKASRCPTCFTENTDDTKAASIKYLKAHLTLVGKSATAAQERFENDKRAVETNRKLLDEVKERLSEYAKWAKEKAHLTDTLSRLVETTTEAKMIVEDQANILKENLSMISSYQKDIKKFETEVSGLSIDLKAFEELNDTIAVKVEKAATSNRLLTEAQVDKGRLQAELQQCKSAMEKVKKYKKQKEVLSKEKFYYTHLAKIFGQEIPSLIIENTCFELSEEANKVLAKISNDSIEFVTQRANQDGSMKEVFEIEITRPGIKHPILLDALSTGQRFRVVFAIRIALSRLLVRRRSSTTMDFLFYDECFGTLDEKGIDDVVDVFRYLREEFTHQLIITHRADLKERFGESIIMVHQDTDGVSEVAI